MRPISAVGRIQHGITFFLPVIPCRPFPLEGFDFLSDLYFAGPRARLFFLRVSRFAEDQFGGPSFLLENPPQHLAHIGLRQCVAEFDPSRDLVAGEIFATEMREAPRPSSVGSLRTT